MAHGRLGVEIVTRDGSHGVYEAPPDVARTPLVFGHPGDATRLVARVSEGRLFVASSRPDAPAFTAFGPIPTEGVELALPCHVLVGEVVLHLFWLSPPRMHPPDAVTVRALRHTSLAMAVAALLGRIIVLLRRLQAFVVASGAPAAARDLPLSR